jgi:hypothetical protein
MPIGAGGFQAHGHPQFGHYDYGHNYETSPEYFQTGRTLNPKLQTRNPPSPHYARSTLNPKVLQPKP